VRGFEIKDVFWPLGRDMDNEPRKSGNTACKEKMKTGWKLKGEGLPSKKGRGWKGYHGGSNRSKKPQSSELTFSEKEKRRKGTVEGDVWKKYAGCKPSTEHERAGLRKGEKKMTFPYRGLGRVGGG